MAESESSGEIERRLHPLYLLFSFFATIRGFVVPILILVFIRGGDVDFLALIFVAPSLVIAALRYASFRYRLGENEIHLRGGVLFRFERHVPYQRIQNLKLVRNLFHRIFGVAGLTIETASGEEVEAQLEVLGLEQVRYIQERVATKGGRHREESPEEAEPEALPDFKLGPFEVMLAGLASNRGLTLALAAIAFLWEQFGGDETRLFLRSLDDRLPAIDLPQGLLAGLGFMIALPLALIALFTLTKLLAMLWSLFRHGGFRMRLVGDELLFRQGLFTEVASTIPRPRIQSVSIRRTYMHRLIDRLELRFVTAGGADLDESGVRSVPILHLERLDEVLEMILPGSREKPRTWLRADGAAWRRLFLRSLPFWTVILAIATFLGGPWSVLLALPLLPMLLVLARRRVGTMSIGLTSDGLLLTRGWPTYEAHRLRYSRVQSVRVAESPFDRRHGQVGLVIDHAGGTFGGSRLRISYLARDAALALAEEIGARAARADFVWR